MEIINCIGFDTPSVSESSSDFLKNLFSVFKTKKRDNDYSSAVAGVDSIFSDDHSAVRSVFYDFRKISELFRKVLSLTGAHLSRILISLGAFTVVSISSVLISEIISNSYNFTGPLKLESDKACDIESLNSRMASFALEKTDDFTSDGTLTDAKPQDLSKIFSQPVTYQTYKVQSGDTISGITKRFGLSNISTLIQVNDIENVRSLSAGQKLRIPSIDGILYTVQKGNSLQGLSAKYNITMEDLLDVNELESSVLKSGQVLFIPGAKLDADTLSKALGSAFVSPIQVKYRLSSFFGHRKDPFTGAPSNHTGIDMACPQGTPIYASAGGKVIFTGYSNIFGNYVIISHSNGYQSLYGHMSKIIARKGENVSQGTRIGLVGSTGYSTGPHLHFSVYKNNQLVNPLPLIKK